MDVTHEAKLDLLAGGQIPDYHFIDKYYKEYQWEDRFLIVVLTHPSFTKADIDLFTKDLKQRNPPAAKHIKLMLLEDFLNTLDVQEKVKSKIDKLYDIVADCLQRISPSKREESLDRLRDIWEESKMILKFPLSQMKFTQFKGSFFNID